MSAIAEMAVSEAERPVDPQMKAAYDRNVAAQAVVASCGSGSRGTGYTPDL